MHGKTAVDALVDAGTSVARAVWPSVREDRGVGVTTGHGNEILGECGSRAGGDGEPGSGGADASATGYDDGAFGTFVVGTLLALAAGRVPLLWVLLAGYVVLSARERTVVLSGFGDWRQLGTAGIRATALIAAVSLPAAAVFVAVGPFRRTSATLGVGSALELGALVAAAGLAALAWHCSVSGILALAWADGRPETTRDAGVRFVRSAATRRLSLAVGGVALTVAVVRFGLRALPVVGPLLAAAATFFGVAVAAKLLGEQVAARTLRADRLATTGRVSTDAPERRERRQSAPAGSGESGAHDGAKGGTNRQTGLRA